MSHYYTIVDFPNDKQNYGKFKAGNPKKAANKAFSTLIKFIDTKNDFLGKFLVFVIKDLNTNEEHKYIGSRIELENPVKFTKSNGTNIEYKYKNVIGDYSPELEKL